MNATGKISLSGLAISVSTAGLLGVSGVALGDDPEQVYCFGGTPCSLGYVPPYTPYWPYVATEASEGYYAYGTCGWDTSSPPECMCNGWVEGEWWDQDNIWHFWSEWASVHDGGCGMTS